jgi:hypothetical protein
MQQQLTQQLEAVRGQANKEVEAAKSDASKNQLKAKQAVNALKKAKLELDEKVKFVWGVVCNLGGPYRFVVCRANCRCMVCLPHVLWKGRCIWPVDYPCLSIMYVISASRTLKLLAAGP